MKLSTIPVVTFCYGLFCSGCVNKNVPVLRDNPYIGYAKKMMGRGDGVRIKDGPHYEYYSIGRKKREFSIKNGKLNGIYTTWGQQGFVTSRILYKDDKIVKDLLKEHYEEGLEAYRIQQAAKREGVSVTKIGLKPPSQNAVKNIGREAIETGAVKKEASPKGDAVEKLGSTSGSAVRRIR